MLEDHRALDAGPLDWLPIDGNRADADRFQAADHAQQRGFAAAGSADEGDELVTADLQIGVLQGGDCPRSAPEGLADATDFDAGAHERPPFR